MDRRRIPNLLTILRLILALVFFAILSVVTLEPLAWRLGVAALFLIAAGTDALDGYLARRWNAESRFGRIMDPVCDKVLVLGAFVFLAGPAFHADGVDSGVMPWMAVVIIAREMLITAIRGMMESSGQSFGAKASGKIKMVLQSFAIPVLIVFSHETTDWAPALCLGIAWAVVLVTIWSGIPYLAAMRVPNDG